MLKSACKVRVVKTTAAFIVGLVFCAYTQAAVLQDYRLGITDQRTRLVYQIDEPINYEIEYDSSSVTIRFESLEVPKDIEAKFKKSRSNLLNDTGFIASDGKIVFQISIAEPFYIRHFELYKPDRVVLDVYRKVEETVVIQAEPETKMPPVATSEEIVEELLTEPERAVDLIEDQEDTGSTEETVYEAIDTAKTMAATQRIEEPEPLKLDTGEKRTFNWLYIVLPILIILLFVIGFITLRRASKRDEMYEEEEVDNSDKLDSEDTVYPSMMEGGNEEVIKAELLNELKREAGLISDETERAEEEAESDDHGEPLDENIETEEILTDEIEPELVIEPVEPEIETESEQEEDLENIEEVTSELPEQEEIEPEPDKSVGESVESSEQKDEEEQDLEAEKQIESKDYSEINGELKEISSTQSPEPVEQAASTEPMHRNFHRFSDEGSAELDFEEGVMTWPVHILEGDRPGRIMVVDDEKEIVNALDEFLKREKYEVLGLTSSNEAVERIQDWNPDLIITDVVMPELSGAEMVQQMIERGSDIGKVIFLSGKTDRDAVSKTFSTELEEGNFEFFRKPLSLVQIGGRIKDYFTRAQEILNLNLLEPKSFDKKLHPLRPQQLVTLQKFLWDKIFEISSNLLGRHIEPYYITDRMEPPANYMRRVGCQEREDYCIANICFGSNPMCAADKIRGELEVMRQIIEEFRTEYTGRVDNSIGKEALDSSKPRRKKPAKKKANSSDAEKAAPPLRKTPRRLVPTRKR